MARAAVTTPPAVDPAQIQGLVVGGYGRLPHARFLLAAVTDAAALRAVLADWAQDVTTGERADRTTAFNVAFTAAGLVAAGLPQDVVLGGFSAPFAEGMVTEHRSRILGDVGAAEPRRWAWGGPDAPPVHVLLLVYAATADDLGARLEALRTQTSGALDVVADLSTDPLGATEPFGFADGISQPRPAGLGDGGRGGTLPTGEFVLGHPNAYGQLTERPLLAAETDPEGLLPRAADGAADLGFGGTYLVFRQLRQEVGRFREFLLERTRAADGSADPAAQERLAARMVGRWPSGAPLVLSPDRDDPELVNADFGYHADPDGLRCPLGAHIRRANPRDSLEPRPGTSASRSITDRHRLLRRGRAYTDGDERGLHFLCLGADISRQYEFVQHTWINDPVFNGLQGQADPLVGPRPPGGTTFVEQGRPVRRRHHALPDFVQVRGGAYFFLPAPSALRYLARMPV